MKRRRCLFPADGFYEWKDEGGHRRPYVLRPANGEPVAFAGLWETWMGPNGEEMETAAIVTTQASRDIAAIHARMPVIIPPDAFDFWLDCANVDAVTAAAVIAPAPAGLLQAYEISRAVNRTANDGPQLIEPVAAEHSAGEASRAAPAAPTKARKKNTGERQSSLF
jgi:putative SOS response-associated peptidase YedK